MERLTIIVPCYDEEEVIVESYKRIRQVALAIENPTDIIYINDGSGDKTRAILDGIATADPMVKVIHFSRNFGHQAAVTAGVNNCHTDLAVILDADMQDPPELIPELLSLRKKENANVVYCVRKSRKGEGIIKRSSSKLFYRVMNRMSEIEFPSDAGDFRLIDRKVMNEFDKFKERGKYVRGLMSWVGFKQIPYYYERDVRLAGKSKYPFRKMVKFASRAMFYFSKKPLKMATGLGFLAVLVGIFLAVWFTLGKIYGFSNAETGWTSIITIVTFFGGVQLLTVGVLGQYIGILFDEVKARPEYIIDEKRNFTEDEQTANKTVSQS